MKWIEVAGVPVETTILVRRPSNRKALLVEKFPPPLARISVRWLDTGEIEERLDPANFDRIKPPVGTVPRSGSAFSKGSP